MGFHCQNMQHVRNDERPDTYRPYSCMVFKRLLGSGTSWLVGTPWLASRCYYRLRPLQPSGQFSWAPWAHLGTPHSPVRTSFTVYVCIRKTIACVCGGSQGDERFRAISRTNFNTQLRLAWMAFRDVCSKCSVGAVWLQSVLYAALCWLYWSACA